MKTLSANLLCSATCAITVIFISGCGEEPGIRRYQERTLPPASTSSTANTPNPHTGNPLMKAPDVPTDQAPMDKPTGPLSWDLPDGWIAMPPAGMRYATIIADPQERTIQCAVFIFGKQGGRYANIERWAGQLGVKKSKAELEAFIARQPTFKSADGLDVLRLDFTELLDNPGPESKSMLAAIVELEANNAFFKIDTTVQRAATYRPAFETLLRSLRTNAGDDS